MLENKKYIILIRHGESFKNIQNVQGGIGQNLTDLGKFQSQAVSKRILKDFGKTSIYNMWSSTSVQTIETADIIAKELNVDLKVLKELAPLYLGEFDGLSNDRIKINFPREYEKLCMWRRREIDISELLIPNMEELNHFWDRGINALRKSCPGVNIYVLTNSTFILLTNILLNRGVGTGEGYKHITIKNCDILIFERKSNETYLIKEKMGDIPISRL